MLVVITIAFSCCSVGLVGCKTTEIIPVGKDNFIQTDPGDTVDGIPTKKPGAWMSDDMMLEQFGIIVGKY